MLPQIIRELLADIRAHLDEALGLEIDGYTESPGGASRPVKRKAVSGEGLDIIEPLEALIARIDAVTADNRGAGI